MSHNTESQVPAFPIPGTEHGLTAREYAAIALRVPDSGTPWLDEMISKARYLDNCNQAMAAVIANPHMVDTSDDEAIRYAARSAQRFGSAMAHEVSES